MFQIFGGFKKVIIFASQIKINMSTRTVTGCTNCVFAKREDVETLGDGQYICTEIARQQIPWEDEDGFDEFMRVPLLGIPKACPLKKSPVTIVLIQ